MYCITIITTWVIMAPPVIPAANVTGYRLSPNGLPSNGLLEVNIPGSCDWGPVRYISRYNSRDPLDNLICQHFGYVNESVIQATSKQTSYPAACMTIRSCPTNTITSIDDIVQQCNIEYGPPQSDFDNIFKEINCIPARLLDGATPLQGRVEAGLFGQLQSICSLGFDARAANVVCASLGYRRGATQLWRLTQFGAGSLPTYKRNITCSGDELSLELCNHSNTDIPGCNSYQVVGVECQGDLIKIEPLFASRPYEGIIEGFHADFQYYLVGNVTTTTAQTMCAIMGYGHVGFAGHGKPDINLFYYKQYISCSGHETSISECIGDLEYCVTQRYYHCFYLSKALTHVALFCSDYKLQGLRLGPDGILLMRINGQHWAVCEDYFTTETAQGACKIMGYIGKASFTIRPTGQHDVEILGSFVCNDTAVRLDDCQFRHQFSYRPYRTDTACKRHVVLNCQGQNAASIVG